MRLTVADHILIEGLSLIAAPRRFPPDPVDVALTVSILHDVLPQCSTSQPDIAKLAEVAKAVVARPPEYPCGGVVTRAEEAIDQWRRARFAAAWDAFRGAAA